MTPPKNSKDPSSEKTSTVSENNSTKKQNAKADSRRPRREWSNSFRPHEHGLMIGKVASRNGRRVEAINELYKSLVARCCPDLADPISLLFAELAGIDYWRLSQAVEFENNLFHERRGCPFQSYDVPNLMRYIAITRRNLEKNIEILLQLQKEAEDAGGFEFPEEAVQPQSSDGGSSSASQSNPALDKAQGSAQPATDSAAVPSTGSAVDASSAAQDSASSDSEAHGAADASVPEAANAGEKPTTELPTAA
jgi:hypothetical protein